MSVNRYYSSVAVATALSAQANAGDTVISVNATTGFPGSTPYTLVLEDGTSNQEVVTVTGVSGLNLTVTRGVDGTTALTHSAGAAVIHGVSARDYTEPQQHIAASSAVHGLTGSVVGTTDTQTLANKTLTTPTVASVKPDGTHTWTFPAATDQAVGRATTDTLTNKTLTSPVINTPSISGSGGALTLPAGPDTLVGRATTDTLTNKTLASPAFSGTASGSLASLTATGATLDSASTVGGVSGTTLASDHAAWTAWTPTIAGGSVGNAVLTFKYKQIGKTVHVLGKFQVGSTTSFPALPNFSLPVQAASAWAISAVNDQSQVPVGQVWMIDHNTGSYTATVFIGSDALSFQFFAALSTDNLHTITSTFPFTLGTGDVIAFSFTYEAA